MPKRKPLGRYSGRKIPLPNNYTPHFAIPLNGRWWVEPELKTVLRGKTPAEFFQTIFLHPNLGKQVFSSNAESLTRSFLIRQKPFRKKGMLFRDIDVKGGGAIVGSGSRNFYKNVYESKKGRQVSREVMIHPKTKRKKKFKEIIGLTNQHYVVYDIQIAKKFAKLKIRVVRPIAALYPNELVYDSQKKSIKSLKEKGLLPKNYKPAILVRAFGVRTRMSDILQLKNLPMLYDAYHFVARELRKNTKDFTQNDYYKWLARKTGEQIGKMHKAGYVHNQISPHNVTADARLVDLATVEKLPAKKRSHNELYDFTNGKLIFRDLEKHNSLQELNLIKEFDKGYKKSRGFLNFPGAYPPGSL